jgi:DNA-binding response OmpR family regulator
MSNSKILIIEDDADIGQVLKLQLELKGYTTFLHTSYSDAQKTINEELIDLFLIDRMLPELSGTEICKILRNNQKFQSTPIIIITALGEPENIIEGLDAGADDYVTKPFDINILHARVRAQLRRNKESKQTTDTYTFGVVEVNTIKCTVKIENQNVSLTHTEYQILTQLITNPGIVFSREKLIHKVLGGEVHVTNRTIDTHIAGLRKKIGPAANYIETIRGIGYRFTDETA